VTPARIALVCAHWEPIGGSERYALWIARQLAARGHELLILHTHGEARPQAHTSFLRLGGAAQIRELRRALLEFAPRLVYVLTPIADAHFECFLDCAPVLRFVQDHTLFCPGLDKMLGNGSACHEPMGAACLSAALPGPGCHGIAGEGRLARAVAGLARTMRTLELHRRTERLLVASEWMRAELSRLGFDREQVLRLPYPSMTGEPPESEKNGSQVTPEGAPSSLPGRVGAVVDAARPGAASPPPAS
jgi:hypothetical protein